MTRDEFEKMEEEVKAAMVAVVRRYGIEDLEFDDYLHFWLEEHTTIDQNSR